jgi:hypothetical protein
MKINPFVYGIMVLTVFLGVILSAQQLGMWSTSGKVASSGEAVQPSAGDVSSVKGWMTLEQVSTTFNAPVPAILSAFDLPADTPASTALKDLESETFDIPTLRVWLTERSSAP